MRVKMGHVGSKTSSPGRIIEQEWQIVARYARLTPSCNLPRNFIAIAIVLEICSRQNSSMKKKTKGNNSKIKQARVKVHVHCTPP